MKKALEQLRTNIEPLRNRIIGHSLYKTIKNVDDLNVFMQHHVYAVWDFMSLLKSLQNKLTCTKIPWMPTANPDTRYLINEIVLGEESDVDIHGRRMSHFELYLTAMRKNEADTSNLEMFLKNIEEGHKPAQAINEARLPSFVCDFVENTFEVINHMPVHVQAGVFTFGREDLIPAMFQSMVDDLCKQHPDRISNFKYYLERHIEVDGNHHSLLALQMTADLCGTETSAWRQVESAVIRALEHRLALWDGICRQIEQSSVKTVEYNTA